MAKVSNTLVLRWMKCSKSTHDRAHATACLDCVTVFGKNEWPEGASMVFIKVYADLVEIRNFTDGLRTMTILDRHDRGPLRVGCAAVERLLGVSR